MIAAGAFVSEDWLWGRGEYAANAVMGIGAAWLIAPAIYFIERNLDKRLAQVESTVARIEQSSASDLTFEEASPLMRQVHELRLRSSVSVKHPEVPAWINISTHTAADSGRPALMMGIYEADPGLRQTGEKLPPAVVYSNWLAGENVRQAMIAVDAALVAIGVSGDFTKHADAIAEDLQRQVRDLLAPSRKIGVPPAGTNSQRP